MDKQLETLRREISAAKTLDELARLEETVDREFKPSPHTESTNMVRGAVYLILLRCLGDRAYELTRTAR